MAAPSERPGSLVESRAGFDPRIIAFHGVIALLLLVLVCGLVYQQIVKGSIHHQQERLQNERRVIEPGPRGDILDREGRKLVENRFRNSVILDLDELRPEFRREFIRVRGNYRASGDKELPSDAQLEQIARVSVVQRYLDQVDTVLGRMGTVDGPALKRHLEKQLLLPYTLVDDLTPDEFARVVENVPVISPMRVVASPTRSYPYGAAAAHVLGYVGVNEDADVEEFPGEGLTTLKMKGTIGRDGLEKEFDARLQGESGYRILRVDPAGYEVNPAIEIRRARQGQSITTSLDIDLQVAAEEAIGEETGAAVAMDVRTGEVLAMASKPGYDLNAFSPRLSVAAAADIEQRKAWSNIALNGVYSPGSTFKIVVSTAALLSGVDDARGHAVGLRGRDDDRQPAVHLRQRARPPRRSSSFPRPSAESCDIYFYTVGTEDLRRGDRQPGEALPPGQADGDRASRARRTGC